MGCFRGVSKQPAKRYDEELQVILLIMSGRERLKRSTAGSYALKNMLLNLILIPMLDTGGAAISASTTSPARNCVDYAKSCVGI
jgi:hypothetical protein